MAAVENILGETLKSRRRAVGIPAVILARKIRISPSRLSALECGHICLTRQEMGRIMAALDELIVAKQESEKVALQFGWPAPAEGSVTR